MTEPLVEVTDLAYDYPDGRRALRDVTLRLERGERLALLGPNGAGKTTLVLHLNGTLTPARGEVRVGGLQVAGGNMREVRRRVGIVFQDPDDQLFMPSVLEDVCFGPANLGLRRDEVIARARAALAAVRMQEHGSRPPHHLSAGEKRRVAIATVLAMDPDVLVLDEPTANLDPAARGELAGLLAGLDVSMLVVTHDLSFALQLCPVSAVMAEGVVLGRGPTPEVLRDQALMAAGRLELPYGFDLARAAAPAGGV